MSYEVKNFAVIGAGNMGSGIAQKIATEGYSVMLVDLDDEKVERGLKIIRDMLQQGVERRIFRPEKAEAILNNIQGTSDWSQLGDVDLVVEAVFEDLGVKRQVFERLSEVTKPTCILGTNTSSFLVKDIASAASNPERVVGLHYFFHPAKNRLVEVIGHEGTDPAAYAAAWAAQEAIGKTPIDSADAPGFVVNRYFVPWINESVRLLEEGIADIATIDWAAKKAFRIGMGPFELMNVTGVPISMHAANTLGQDLHRFYLSSAALTEQVESGRGDWNLEGDVDESKYDAIADRLFGVVFYVATQLIDEGVSSVEDTDIGARVGLRWSNGPIQMLNRVGGDRARELAEAITSKWGLDMPKLLAVAPAEGIPIQLVASGTRGSMSTVWINRPDAMNALNPDVGAQLDAAMQNAYGKNNGVMLGGNGKAFIAGADIKFFVDHLRADTYDNIQNFAAHGHQILNGMAAAEVAVVARMQGLALGGGAEMALGCDWIVASNKAMVGFPETGIGIFPGMGGTQRLTRRVGAPLAKYLVFTGQFVDARSAMKIGLIDAVTDFAGLDATCEAYGAQGKAPEREAPNTCPDPNWQAIWDFFASYSVDQMLSGEAKTDGNPVLDKAVKTMGFKSYNALKLAENLINEGALLDLPAALECELRDLKAAFTHEDGIEGLSSMIEGRRPTFQSPAKV
jgi:enoyl-CoA hydratase / 3-hydroxyacyl-CoA dehydrogenase